MDNNNSNNEEYDYGVYKTIYFETTYHTPIVLIYDCV